MDTPIVLSHQTACLFYRTDHAVARGAIPSAGRASAPNAGIENAPTASDRSLTPRRATSAVKELLQSLGVAEAELNTVHLAVGAGRVHRPTSGLVRHALRERVLAAHAVEVAKGIRVVDPSLLFIQAAQWMDFLQLGEFGYELSGDYRLGPSGTGYARAKPLVDPAALSSLLSTTFKRCKGSHRASGALRYIRGGSRSPMETALAMLICLPQNLGGLGINDIELNYRIDIVGPAQALTKSEYFEIDLYHPASRRGAEYDGWDHAEAKRREHDAERRNALEEMGVYYKTLTAGQFNNQLSLHRAMNAIAHSFGVEAPTSKEFQTRQNELREFLIRNWT